MNLRPFVLSICILFMMEIVGVAPCCVVQDEDLDWFTDARFGMFVHWGPVSLRGTEIGWSRGREVPVEEYDALYKQFNPTDFDAHEWVAIANAAGMKYLVITTKHHDGFSIWDSKYTDYDIMATPFRRDVLAELSEACREAGIVFCTYHSICDWYHPDYLTDSPGGSSTKAGEPNMDRYFTFLKNQTAELIENYGPIGVMWFDGEWEKPWTVEHGMALYAFLKGLQPDLIINNRVGKGRHGMAGTTLQSTANPGDYDTPEQQIGAFNRDRPWETCMTLCRQWAWKPNDTMKSLDECLHTLVRTVGGDGNLLFNVGPMPDGRIEPRQVERLKEMGAWLDQYGQAIYRTRGGPFMPGDWGASTCAGDVVFVHVLDWQGEETLALPMIDAGIRSVKLLTGDGKVEYEVGRHGLSLTVAREHQDAIDTIVELTLDRNAFDVEPVRKTSGSLAHRRPVKASNVFQDQMAQFGPARAVDDDAKGTRWATDWATESAWLEVDLGEAVAIDRVSINEATEYGKRVERFSIEYRTNEHDSWQVAFDGASIGAELTVEFEAVEARYVRLNILEANEGPTIWEFQVFGAGGEDQR